MSVPMEFRGRIPRALVKTAIDVQDHKCTGI